ncbi:Zinc finger protein 79 [Eumeta japonica]|uniref:Zinc finger protein 79 n=1 Tax=Eumeta variegata TaxID=151549 RepID=A0A4C1TBG4_EUMVA|nr:Zinc finger protein 79 [Eumeta japonica]
MQTPSETAGVCGGCGCGERALAPAGPLAARLYRLVLADALVESVESRLCWECRGRLAAFARFARRAAHAQRGLLLQAQGGSTFTPWPPRLQAQRAAVLYCGPHDPSTPLPKVEPRPDSVLVVKPEPVDVYEEPPDRVDALALPVPSPAEVKKRKRKKEKGTAKKKNSKRTKKKPKEKLIEQNGGESSDGLSDLGSLLDLYADEKTVSEEREEAKVDDLIEELVPGASLLELSAAEAAAERERALRSTEFAAHPHKCTQCVDTFESQSAAEEHATAFHSQGGEHACDICGARVESESMLAAHRARHTRRYACDSCAHRTRSAAEARQHRRTHRPSRAHPTRDDQTEVEPPTESAAATGAGAGTRPRCVECNKEFSSRKTYRYHLSVIHEGRNRYPCATCGKVYQWKSNLWRHMKNHAARAAGELYCTPCRRAFASVATYTQHLRASRRHVREDQFRYACADCGRRFPTKTRLRDHVDWDHLQAVRHRCDACHKPFKSKMSLYVHVKNVHRRADAGLNLCHVCGKSYQNQAKLKYHIVAMHTTETPYSCARCGAAFGWYSSLYRHQREVHDKIKLQPKRARPKKGEGAAPPPAPAPPLLPHGGGDAL